MADPRKAEQYRRHRERMQKRQADISRHGREMPPLPPIADPARRAAARRSFQCFAETYLRHLFALAWSPDHLTAIARIEAAVLRGLLFAMAMPRGTGKTTLVLAAVLWAALYGHRRFIVLIGSDTQAAAELLEDLRVELETNDLLAADFPEVCAAIRLLQRTPQKRLMYGGRMIYLEWHTHEVVLPTIPGSAASGVAIVARGLLARIRGMKRGSQRPDLVVPDDPQTDQSAASDSQCTKRLNVLAGAILGLAGPGRRIAGIMPCTVIRKGDMADQILDPARFPQWHGLRTRMLLSPPSREDLWTQYGEMRAEGLRTGDEGKAATAFYAEHQAEMDAGAKVYWPERKNPDELSAIQNAMNLKLQDPQVFAAEYQNDPQPPESLSTEQPNPELIRRKLNRLPRGTVPAWAHVLTCYIDISKKLLWYEVAAWKNDFAGAIAEYGAFPDQGRRYYTLADAQKTLARKFPGRDLGGTIYAGLEALVDELAGREWPVEGGGVKRIDRIGIDANWGDSTDTVYQFCRQSKHAALLLPCHGKYIGCKGRPMAEWQKTEGDRAGHHWRIPNVGKKRIVRHLLIDTNYWKSFAHEGLRTPMGSARCVSLYGADPEAHRMWVDQLAAEHVDRVTANGRTLEEWSELPSHPDNHGLDCHAGCAALASLSGCQAIEAREAPRPRRRPRVRYFH
jgi:hypothetical protein